MGWPTFVQKIEKPMIWLNGQHEHYGFYPGKKSLQLNRVSKFSRAYMGQTSQGRPIVIKVLPEELALQANKIASFRDETRWNNLHNGLLAPFEYLYQDGRHYLISEYIPSINMGEYIKQRWIRQTVRVRLAIQCGLQLLDAVEVIHNHSMIHTDIKPSNVLLLKQKGFKKNDPEFKLIDFGMVRRLDQIPDKTHKKGELPFALVFAPPEQVLGFYELMGFHSDLYNIALLMYEIITGEPVYQTDMTVKLINLQTSFPLPETKLIPSQLFGILKKAAAKYHFRKPPNHYKKSEVYSRLLTGISQRYVNAAEFRDDLLKFKLTQKR